MKRIIYLFIGFVVPLLCFGADNVQLQFATANASYNKGQFKEALAGYQQILNEGYESAALYFNTGNAFYKTGDVNSALLYYGKAHKLSPGDEDINNNIRFVNQKTTDKIDEAPEFFLAKWWHGFILGISANTLGIISVILFLLASGVLVLYFFARSVGLKKASFYISLVFYILGAFAIFIGCMQVNYFNSHHEAIVFSNSVNVRSSPAEKSAALFVIHDGTKVGVLDKNNGWLKIKLANGSEGWIKGQDAKEI